MGVYSKPYSEREGSEFQDYPQQGFSIEFREASHRYHGHIGGERQSWVSVTSALGIIDKPQLRRWQGNQDATATLELERSGELVGIPTDQAIHVVRQRGFGAEAKRDAGADRGKAVHQALREYCESGVTPALGDFPESVRGYVQAVCGWLVEAAPEPLLVEQIVGSPSYRFAGRFDLLAVVDGFRTLIDLKTTSRAYPEHHVQLAGYRYAMQECGIEGPDRMLILSAAETGHFKTTDCRATPEHFLGVLNAHRAMTAVKAAVKSEEQRQLALDG